MISGEFTQIVLVDWLSSFRRDGWMPLEHGEKDIAVMVCSAVGWILAEGRDSLTISGQVSVNPAQCCGAITIPTGAIIRVQELDLGILLTSKQRKTESPLRSNRAGRLKKS